MNDRRERSIVPDDIMRYVMDACPLWQKALQQSRSGKAVAKCTFPSEIWRLLMQGEPDDMQP
eukprot:2324676-Heterocapsa_arctica.AAC.1